MKPKHQKFSSPFTFHISLLVFVSLFTLHASQAQQGTIQLPATGQITSYYPGDDGDLQVGIPIPENRFTDHGNGSATDGFTGLMWVTDGNLIATKDPDFDQYRTVGDGDIDWKTATAYVLKLNEDNYLGYNDWRVPNINELKSLINLEVGTTIFPEDNPFTNLKNMYWSSTTSDQFRGFALMLVIKEYYIHENLIHPAGEVDWSSKNWKADWVSERYFLLPVRTSAEQGLIKLPRSGQKYTFYEGDDGDDKIGSEWPCPRLVDNIDGSVTDRLTGLMWTRDANLMYTRDPEFDTTGWTEIDGMVRWETALGYIKLLNNENYLGYSDWRLPNRNEMHSLIDYSQKWPMLPEYHPFINAGSGYWTSSTINNNKEEAWMVNINYGINGEGSNWIYSKLTSLLVWPVRTDNNQLPDNTISGQVLLDGNPFPGVQISLKGPINAKSNTNLNGSYEFSNLPDGQYQIVAFHKYAGMDPYNHAITLSSSNETCDFNAHYTRAYGWMDISENLYRVGNAAGGSFTDLQFFGDEGWITNGYEYEEIYHTTDGGETWEVQETMGPNQAIHMLTPLLGYSGDNDRHIMKTTDGGQNWEWFGFAQSPIRDIEFPPSGDVGFVSGMEAKIAKISPEGVEWFDVGSVTWYALCFPESENFGMAFGGFGGTASWDGTSWDYHGSALYWPSNNDAQYLTNELGWYVTSDQIVRINGIAGTVLYEDEENLFYGLYALNKDSLWVVTARGDIYSTSQASADTVHWMIDHIGDEFLVDVFAVDAHKAYAIGTNGVLYKYGLLDGFPAGGADILDFVVDQQVMPSVIDPNQQTIHVIVEQGTDLTQLIPEIFISPAATIEPPGGTLQDLTNPFVYSVTSENGQTVKDWTVTVNISNALSELMLPEIMLYPNPTHGKIHITNSNTQINSKSQNSISKLEVVDIYGKVAECFNPYPVTRNPQLDISHLSDGIYFVRISFDNQIIVKKIIKI